ncbi:MAG: ABC transporter permease [Lachnospiraceae bacterium]|nr:ABC transporter permease [Lachnospiraceae bacterium]
MRRRFPLKNHKLSRQMMAAPYTAWIILFIVVPLGMVFYYGLTDKTGAFTLENVLDIMSAEHAKALWYALGLSLISTLICFLLAYPLAMILADREGNAKLNRHSLILLIFILPMWMNFLLRTLAWQTLLEKTGVINRILEFFHLPSLQIINTPYAIILGMVYNFLPFMVLPIYNALVKIDPNVISAAQDLGANRLQTFLRITFPLSLGGVISGITMVFIPALTTFVISKLLGGSKILLIGNVIEEEFTLASNWHLGSGLSIVLMLFIILNMVVSAIFDKEGEGNML